MEGVRNSLHQSLLAKRLGLRLGLLCWGFKGGSSGRDSIGRGQHSSNRVSGISTRTMHQSTAPSLSQTIWPRWHQHSSTPSLLSRLCPLWLLVIPSTQRLPLWDNWGDERGCDEGHWHANTRGPPWDIAEVVGMVQVHCSQRSLLRRGLEFHVSTINKSAHTKKRLETYLVIFLSLGNYKVLGNDFGYFTKLFLFPNDTCIKFQIKTQNFSLLLFKTRSKTIKK